MTLENAGAATLTSVYYADGMTLQDGAGIDNQPGGRFTFVGNPYHYGGAYNNSDSSPTFFANEGSLIRAGSSNGQTLISASNFTQTSIGSTVLDGGAFEFDGIGTISGSMIAASGTTLTFAGASTSFDIRG